jgi:hypothetical protein
MPRPAEVEAAFQVDKRYSPASVPTLAKYVDTQLATGEYDLEVNLAVLKLMLIHPETSDAAIIRKILMKALLSVPSSDFQLCMYQIPERLWKSDDLKRIIDLANLLDMAKFQQFWREAATVSDLDSCKNWREAIRTFIVDVVILTYQSIELKDFAELLDLKGKEDEAKKLIPKDKVDLQGDTLMIKHEEEAAAVEAAPPQQLTLDQLKKVLVSVR